MMSITALPYSISDIDFIYKNKNISILLAFYLKLNKLLEFHTKYYKYKVDKFLI